MGITAPVRTRCFEKWLEQQGCKEDKKSTNHRKFKCPGCRRSLIMDRGFKEIPFIHVKTNIKHMGWDMPRFKEWEKENC